MPGDKSLFRHRSPRAYAVLWSGLGIELALLVPAAYSAFPPCIPLAPGWTPAQVYLLILLIALPVSGEILHGTDSGWGVRGALRTIRPGYSSDSGSTGAILARQAIYGAISLGVLLFIVDKEGFTPGPASAASWQVLARADSALLALAVASLGFSVLTVLISALCYDAVLRPAWLQQPPQEQHALRERIVKHLLHKGGVLEAWSWYALIWALLVLIARWDWRVGYLALTAVFVLHWCYYSFPAGITEGMAASGPAGNDPPPGDSRAA